MFTLQQYVFLFYSKSYLRRNTLWNYGKGYIARTFPFYKYQNVYKMYFPNRRMFCFIKGHWSITGPSEIIITINCDTLV